MININVFFDKLGDNNREKKYNYLISFFNPTLETKIIDVGASEKEYRLTANILEKRFLCPHNIKVLGVDKYETFIKRYPSVKVVTYDGGIFPFGDNEFDLCWCNAVIEHVGGIDKQREFLKEIKRVAKHAFVTTPNRFFPVELHTKVFLLHFLPKKLFDWFLLKIGKSWATKEYVHLLGGRQIIKLLKDCGILDYKIIKNKLSGFIVDYMIIF